MSLRYETSAIEGHEELCWVPDPEQGGVKLHVVTQTLVFATMSVGLGRITAANASEFYARVKLIETLHGPLFWTSDAEGKISDGHISPEDVRAHIGLRTNVKDESRASFVRRNVDVPLRESVREYKLATEKVAVS